MNPACDAVTQILAIGVNIDVARSLQCFQSHDCGSQLHTVVGGAQLPALDFLAVAAGLKDGCPTAGAGIGIRAAIGVDDYAIVWIGVSQRPSSPILAPVRSRTA